MVFYYLSFNDVLEKNNIKAQYFLRYEYKSTSFKINLNIKVYSVT